MKTLPHRFALAGLLLASLLFTACQGPEVRYYPLNNPVGSGSAATPGPSTYAPTNPLDIKLYIAKKPVQPFTEMGILAFTSPSSQPNETEIYDLFKQKAAEIGADGVIMLPSREQNESFWQTTGYPYDWYYGYGGPGYSSGYSYTLTTFRGLAIKFK